jgi:hypothetical protein
MKPNQLVEVIADRKGTIVGVSRLAEDPTQHEVQTRPIPLPGQVVVEVRLPLEFGALETVEDFRRLVTEFDLPRGAKALRRKRVAKGKKATPRRTTKRA